MKKLFCAIAFAAALAACGGGEEKKKTEPVAISDNKELAAFFHDYYEERLKYFPLEATSNGDNRYNDKLYADFTDSYRAKLKSFWQSELDALSKFNRDSLNANDQVSYDIFRREMEMSLEGLQFHDHYMPTNQFWGLPLTMGQLGSGEGNQPFKTVKDYDDWASRAKAFSAWTDSAVVYFRKGMATGYVLPKTLVVKMIPQFEAMVVTDVSQSLFYSPVKLMPGSFSPADKERISKDYVALIKEHLVPSYKKLGDFLRTEYLPKSRETSGINVLPDGEAYYRYLIRYWTTTSKTPEEIYKTGLAEVERITGEMEKTKQAVGFEGDLKAFFDHLKTDKKLMPFKQPEEVLNAFRDIQKKIDPKLSTMFGRVPKTKFEIRQTEAFRAASASAEYIQGSADGSRPGIFYVPILDATKFNITSGMESLFLHEAIPGHHYQMSLQQENEGLPDFRRFLWYGSYGEGWALYCESLGKELGCYTDPYQYMGALGDEMHRAVRLVVDVGLHTGKMTREEAIRYFTDHEAISLEGATAEIERYMAIPGQALSYKIGALKIRELRSKYEQQLGAGFHIAAFHDEFLKDGVMPLDLLEKKMDLWAETASATAKK